MQVRLLPVSMAPLGVASAVHQLPQLTALLHLTLADDEEGVSAQRPSAADKWRFVEPKAGRGLNVVAGPLAALLSGLRAANAGPGRAGSGRPAAAQPLGGLVSVLVSGGGPAEAATELVQFRALGEELAHWDGVKVEVSPDTDQEPYAEAVGALLRGAAGVITELRLEASDEGRGAAVLAALLRWGRWGRCGNCRQDWPGPSFHHPCPGHYPAPPVCK
jgi:hypothetical protein